jgi:hypothetical protein
VPEIAVILLFPFDIFALLFWPLIEKIRHVGKKDSFLTDTGWNLEANFSHVAKFLSCRTFVIDPCFLGQLVPK